MKVVLKILLFVAFAIYCLFDYRVLTFNKGISKSEMNGSFSYMIETIVGIQKVEYYEKVLKNEDGYDYKVYIQTVEDSYLLNATQDDIDSFKILGIFSGNLKPNKIQPLNFYIKLVIGFLILCIPVWINKDKDEVKSNDKTE